MTCDKCGKEFSEGIFCPYCGQKIGANIEHNKKKNWILWSLLGTIIIVCLIVLGVFLGQKEQSARSDKFINLLIQGDETEAAEFYQNKIANDEEKVKETTALAKSNIDMVVKNYYDGSISYDEAIADLDKYSGFYDGIYDSDVKEAIARLDLLSDSHSVFAKAEAEFKNGNYKEALSLYAKVIEQDQDFDNAGKRQKECYDAIKTNTISKAEEKAAEGKYTDAISILQGEYDFLSDDQSELDKKIADYKQLIIQESIEKANEYLDNKEYVSGVNYIDVLLDYVKKDENIRQLRAELVKGYEDEVTSVVDSYKRDKEYAEAILYIKSAHSKIPESKLISDMETELTDYLPISFSEVFLFEETSANKGWCNGVKDIYQNEYTEALKYIISYVNSKEHQETWLLNGDYQHFSATLATDEKWASFGTYDFKFGIYLDGIKVKDYTIQRDTKPIQIELDTTGIEKISFSFVDTNGYAKYFYIAEPRVYKKY